MNHLNSFIIFSTERAELSPRENLNRVSEAGALLDEAGIGYKLGLGRYKGTSEVCFIVNYSRLAAVLLLCQDFGQESFLLVDSNGRGALFSPENKHIAELGRWQEVSEKEAAELDSYSLINNKYYSCL